MEISQIAGLDVAFFGDKNNGGGQLLEGGRRRSFQLTGMLFWAFGENGSLTCSFILIVTEVVHLCAIKRCLTKTAAAGNLDKSSPFGDICAASDCCEDVAGD